MHISIETTGGLERRMTISVPSAEFERKVSDRLRQASQKVRMDGFRPGKVPMKEVRRRYGQGVRQEVAREVMQSSYFEAIRGEDLSPAGNPSLEVLKIDSGDDFEFAATFEVLPQVELVDFARIEVKRPSAEITDADLDRMVERLREQRQTFVDVERGAADTDQVTVDFLGHLDGEEFEGGRGEDVTFVVGQGQMIEDFDAAVRGVAAGQTRAFEATFPEDYRAEQLKGRTVAFEVTVKKVAERVLPELDAEFFETFGVEDGGLEAFRAEVQENMARELSEAIRTQVKKQVLDELARLHDVLVPEALVHGEIHSLKQQFHQQIARNAHDQELPEMPDEPFRDEAVRRIKISLVINEVVNKHEIHPDAEQVRAHIEALAKPYTEPEAVVNWYYSNQEQLARIESRVVEEKTVDHILASATVEQVSSSYEDVVSGRAIGAGSEQEPSDA